MKLILALSRCGGGREPDDGGQLIGIQRIKILMEVVIENDE